MSDPYRTYYYTYGNSDFGDQLTAYDGETITYDELGNPLSYYNGSNYTFTWTGRELTTATKGSGSVISYEYNASGMRTSKTVGGAKTLYFYDGDRLVGEMNGTNITVYLYSPDGGIVGMQVRSLSSSSSTWTTYWYEKNLQGDIVAIFGDDSTKYATYRYDSWGNHVVNYTNGGGSITAIANNPFRYRSYYYDTDLGLYYLGSRYYDSAICRFINMDAIGVINASPTALTDKNLYAYCDNNPVMRVDHGGEFWNYVVGGIVGGITGAVAALLNGEDAGGIVISTLGGIVSGVVAASGLGWVTQAGISAGISAVADMSNQAIDINSVKGSILDYNIFQTLTEATLGFATSGIGSGIGSVTGRYLTKTSVVADMAFDKYLEKTFSAGLRAINGRSYSALLRQASNFLTQATYYDNITRGVSSVIGSSISLWNILR